MAPQRPVLGNSLQIVRAPGGTNGFDRSCANFLHRLDDLLVRPWHRLSCAEKAFVAGYYCHLAADDDWKQFDWHLLHNRGTYVWTELPVPPDVILTAFDVLSAELYVDHPAVGLALSDVAVPDVFTHVPHGVFSEVWQITRPHALNGRAPESYFDMLRRAGKIQAEVEYIRAQHERYWDDAVAVIRGYFGGVESRVDAMAQHALDQMPILHGAIDTPAGGRTPRNRSPL